MFLEEQFLSDSNIYRANTLQTKPKDSDDVAPFVVTYNPALPRISNILRKQFNMLQYTLLTSANHGLSPLEKCKFSDCIKISFRETSRATKKKCFCKKKSTTIFHGLHSVIDHRNDAMKCSKLCSETIHLSFEHFMTSFVRSIRVQTMKNCGRFVK